MGAVYGDGNAIDYACTIASYLKTTTVNSVDDNQYMCVFMNTETSVSTPGSATVLTASARLTMGITQDMLSSGSNQVTVRLHGISKAVCRDSVTAGSPFIAYEGASTTSGLGCIQNMHASLPTTYNVLGTALQNGQTGEIITVYLNPINIYTA